MPTTKLQIIRPTAMMAAIRAGTPRTPDETCSVFMQPP